MGWRKCIKKRTTWFLLTAPPNFNVVTKTAIVASDYILIPAKPDYLSTLGIDYLQRSVKQLIEDFNDYAGIDSSAGVESIAPAILGVVFTMISIYGGQPISAIRPFIAQTKQLGVHRSTITRDVQAQFRELNENRKCPLCGSKYV